MVPATKYGQVMDDIRKKIISGEYPLNSKLPSEVRLQNKYHVSRVTVRLAVDELVKDGMVERVQGKGSYVRKPHRISQLVSYNGVEGFTDVAKDSGLKTSTKVLKAEIIKSNERLKKILQNDNDHIVITKRLRYLEQDPIFIEVNYYPMPRFKNLLKYDLTQSLYQIFDKEYNIKDLTSDDTILSVKLANSEEASLLNKSIGFPLYYLRTQIKEKDGLVVQYGEEYIASDRYQFKI
ncbi:GntR family transcriptional regulator (plasmid) [Lactobacillus acidophilus]